MRWQEFHRKLLALAETDDFLTDSQRHASRKIQKEIADYEQRINLCGGPGVGKTFLSHYLHHQSEVLYFSSPETYQPSEASQGDVILLDNAPHDRQEARLLYGDVLWAGASSVVLVTRQPIRDAVRRVDLSLTAVDIAQIQNLPDPIGIQSNMRQQFSEFPLGNLSDSDWHRSGIWACLKSGSMAGLP
jgi:hypothetical protein